MNDNFRTTLSHKDFAKLQEELAKPPQEIPALTAALRKSKSISSADADLESLFRKSGS